MPPAPHPHVPPLSPAPRPSITMVPMPMCHWVPKCHQHPHYLCPRAQVSPLSRCLQVSPLSPSPCVTMSPSATIISVIYVPNPKCHHVPIPNCHHCPHPIPKVPPSLPLPPSHPQVSPCPPVPKCYHHPMSPSFPSPSVTTVPIPTCHHVPKCHHHLRYLRPQSQVSPCPHPQLSPLSPSHPQMSPCPPVPKCHHHSPVPKCHHHPMSPSFPPPSVTTAPIQSPKCHHHSHCPHPISKRHHHPPAVLLPILTFFPPQRGWAQCPPSSCPHPPGGFQGRAPPGMVQGRGAAGRMRCHGRCSGWSGCPGAVSQGGAPPCFQSYQWGGHGGSVPGGSAIRGGRAARP